jgi:hypothetical protein
MQTQETIVVTATDLLNSQQAIQNLTMLKLPARTAYWISKTANKVGGMFDQLSRSVQEGHNDLCVKYGSEVITTNEDGSITPTGQFSVNPEHIEAFNLERRALSHTPVEIEVVRISLADLGNAEVSAADMTALNWLIVE